MRWCVAGLVLLSAVLTVSAQTNAVGHGIITVLDGKFVDANCREYQFAGLLAFYFAAPAHAGPAEWISFLCVTRRRQCVSLLCDYLQRGIPSKRALLLANSYVFNGLATNAE